MMSHNIPPQQHPGQPPAGQRHAPSWHSQSDIPRRRDLINEVIRLFQQRRPNIAKEWQKKLPDFVRRLESALYQSAPSLEAYQDQTTLEQRLQTVARKMMMRNPRTPGDNGMANGNPVSGPMQGNPMAGQMSGQPHPHHQMQHPMQAMYSGRGPNMVGGSQHMQGGPPGGPPMRQGSHPGISMPPHHGMHQMMPMSMGMRTTPPAGQRMDGDRSNMMMAPYGRQGPKMPGHMPGRQDDRGTMGPNMPPNMASAGMSEMSMQQSGPVMSNGAPVLMRNASFPSSSGHGGQHMQRVTINGMAPGQLSGQSGSMVTSTANMQPGMHYPQQNYQGKPEMMPMPNLQSGAPSSSAQTPTVSMPPSRTGQPSREEQHRMFIMKQIRWLLFLRHAHKCQAPEGQCSAGQHCVVARKLWAHILKCTDPKCQYPRCVASRELLKHHQKCTNSRCPVCGPVREHIETQRSRQMQVEQYRMQQAQQGHVMGTPAMPPGAYNNNKPMVMMPPEIPVKKEGAYQKGPPSKRVKREDTKADVKPKLEKQKGLQGTSLLECFTEEEITKHLQTLKIETGTALQKGAKGMVAKGAKIIEQPNNQACSCCGMVKLLFEPPPLYCLTCNSRIKKGQTYYFCMIDINKHSTCSACFNACKDNIIIDGRPVSKSKLKKKKNEESLEEPWVCCDFCDAWVHQVCALFNKGTNEGGAGQYACPDCLMKGLKDKSRKPITNRPSAMLEAKDLAKTKLSDFLESRLQNFLKREREKRAETLGKKLHEVPTADGLTVRIVSVNEKVFSVMPNFAKQFEQEGCAIDMKYASKVLLLFQKVDGVDLCLFCMYVQEYDKDCPNPNTRRTYLSYLDSVRYFKPEGIVAFGGDKNGRGDSLRTLVYMEIICGYLQYLKTRGFTSMYIWACPPLPGDDYIFYVHPQRQKTPKSDRLREWYLRMLKHAKEQKIVEKTSNLWDLFFEGGKDHRVDPCRAVDLPYFEGDYIPGALEEYLDKIHAEQAEERKNGKKAKKTPKGSSSRGKGKRIANGMEDVNSQVMTKLGDQIKGMKDDFIMVHLQPICSYCRKYILHPEKRFVCETCPKFELCERCYKDDCGLDERSRHPTGSLHVHTFKEVNAPQVKDTSESDVITECEIFDTRQSFLSLCQGNHYQFDTFRRAKHSSMMVLYHLHNPSAPAFTSTCNVCSRDLEPGQGFRCTVCTDYDVCIDCKKKPGFSHPHELKMQSAQSDARMTRLSDEERRARQEQLRKTMQLLVHASSCQDPKCPHPSCIKVKMLFQHSLQCQIKATGGCQYCRRMWALLQLHAKSCTMTNCPVPRCRDLKNYRRYATAKAEARRRAHFNQIHR